MKNVKSANLNYTYFFDEEWRLRFFLDRKKRLGESISPKKNCKGNYSRKTK